MRLDGGDGLSGRRARLRPIRAPRRPGAAKADASGTFPRPERVAVMVLENRSFGQVIGSPKAPYINSLARRYAQQYAPAAVRANPWMEPTSPAVSRRRFRHRRVRQSPLTAAPVPPLETRCPLCRRPIAFSVEDTVMLHGLVFHQPCAHDPAPEVRSGRRSQSRGSLTVRALLLGVSDAAAVVGGGQPPSSLPFAHTRARAQARCPRRRRATRAVRARRSPRPCPGWCGWST